MAMKSLKNLLVRGLPVAGVVTACGIVHAEAAQWNAPDLSQPAPATVPANADQAKNWPPAAPAPVPVYTDILFDTFEIAGVRR